MRFMIWIKLSSSTSVFGSLMILPSKYGAMMAERVLSKDGSVMLISRGLGKPYLRFCNPTEITMIDIRL